MIISPRAEEIVDVLRKHGSNFVKINKVLLYRWTGSGVPYREIVYWERGGGANELMPAQTSFVIVPEMADSLFKGYSITGNILKNSGAVNAWLAFNRNVQTAGSFGSYDAGINSTDRYAWAVAAFPEPRMVRGWALQFEQCYNAFWLAVEGKVNGMWIRLFESSPASPVNHGRYGATAVSLQCTAVRILTDYSSYPVRSCQFFETEPLVPVTMSSNSSAGVELLSDPINYNLFRCFTEQSNTYTHGTTDWFRSDGDWRHNRGQAGTQDQNRFFIRFTGKKEAGGFSVGGIVNYNNDNCYANCLLIEGRESDTDFWQSLGEIDFEPAERRTRYFDFAKTRTVTQLRITVQDVTHGTGVSNSMPAYLPPMQVYGVPVIEVLPPSSGMILPSSGGDSVYTAGNNVIIIEENGETTAIPISE